MVGVISPFVNMNSFNAVGFLALGSLMNAMPAVMPSLVARGPLLGDMTTGALWLHFMGLVVGLIGSSWMMREIFAYHAALRSMPSRRTVQAEQSQGAYAQTDASAVQVVA